MNESHAWVYEEHQKGPKHVVGKKSCWERTEYTDKREYEDTRVKEGHVSDKEVTAVASETWVV